MLHVTRIITRTRARTRESRYTNTGLRAPHSPTYLSRRVSHLQPPPSSPAEAPPNAYVRSGFPSEAQRTAAAPPALFSSTSLPLWTRQAARPYHPACHRDCRSSAPISPKAGLAACLLSDLPEAGLAACGRSWRDDDVGRVLGALEASREDLARAPVLWVRGERRSSGGAR